MCCCCSLAAAELFVSWCCLGQLGLLPVDGFFQFHEILHVVAGDWCIGHEREAKQHDVWNDSCGGQCRLARKCVMFPPSLHGVAGHQQQLKAERVPVLTRHCEEQERRKADAEWIVFS